MDLRQNILDSVKECEIKLGYREEPLSLYYPKNVLLELLAVPEQELEKALADFSGKEKSELGNILITETKEAGRYQVTVPKEGVAFVHKNIAASPFVKEFVEKIHNPGMTKDSVVALFKKYSEDVAVEQAGEQEWVVCFVNPQIDAYVYYIEEDDFGLQYHRFTHQSYRVLLENK